VTTWEEFRTQAVARAGMHAIGGEVSHRLAYLALGLCGETGEAIDTFHAGPIADIVTELGDVAWYLAMIEHTTGLRVTWPAADAVGRHVPHVATLRRAVLTVAECAKRPMQGRALPLDRMLAALNDVGDSVYWLASSYGGLAAICDANIAKNVARYGDGFTAEKARGLDVRKAGG